MVYPKIPLAQSIINIALAKGLTQIVISPGSRNAPLTIGFVNNPAFACYSIADERCAAFFAMGIAQQTRKPVAVICTSGSALLNYYPAFAEAFYSQIPLVIISADRPSSKIDIGDGQTIRQRNVFKNHSLYNANLTENNRGQNELDINEAINRALTNRGPVHINAPFEEPLYETTTKISYDFYIEEPFDFEYLKDFSIKKHFVDYWNSSSKKLVLVGVDYPNVLSQENIDFLANNNSVVVFTETTSNLHHSSFINNIDSIITPFAETDCQNFRPEILITFGGMIVSKRIKAMLRKHQPNEHWHVDELRAYNTFGVYPEHFEMTPNQFFDQLRAVSKKVESTYYQEIDAVKQLREKRTKEYLDKIPFSDFKAFKHIIESLPRDSMLQISNSSAIRYAQLIDIDPTISVFCNRGTSGIDGSTSTAIGAAVASEKQTIFITGDISFFYDSNALWNSYIPTNFKIILINNGGGGIFRILPGHEETPVFNQFFETSHCLTAEHLARMYGFEYQIASSVATVKDAIRNMYSLNQKPFLLEIFTPTLENDKILLQFFNELV
ncbi:MAG: hypothetical protein RLZZ312_1300 [Bacteroidota bacterium]|jgi:2-succinyl-5-enolpyruvyl-6-hydroxy-3-cyclohexene-1-carboxylate synthase